MARSPPQIAGSMADRRSPASEGGGAVEETAMDAVADDGSPAAAAAGQVYLVCHREEGIEVFAVSLGESLVVGRAPDAAVRIESPRVSRHHARVSVDEQGILVEDLGSRNGTRVNRDVLRSGSARVAGGDVLKVGPLEMVVARAATAAATPPSPALAAPPDGPDEELKEQGIVVADPAMVKLFATLRRLAPSPATVLILGETGAGKEVIAEQVHRLSPRARGPFVRLNCASLPDALLESELFGHERGAFTGADRSRGGYFEAADAGTLLLDEIGEIPLLLQSKLLRVLEAGRVTRLGATTDRPVDVRVLCATHRDLALDVQAGRFRQDLFYRISTFTLRVPPLRERPMEIQLLADRMGRRVASRMGLAPSVITPPAAAVLVAHAWPGNLRELRNVMEYAVVMAGGAPIELKHLPESLGGAADGGEPGAAAPGPQMRDQLAEIERASIQAALAAAGDNRTHAAKRLGISRRALIYKMIKYGLRE
jgi:transcriptional regulator with PAS, ATPase and Fis domain